MSVIALKSIGMRLIIKNYHKKTDSMNRIFFSPHSDDIAYSCFGTLYGVKCDLQTDLIVTVFSRTNQEDVRIKEDQDFCKKNNCKHKNLDYQDAPLVLGDTGDSIYGKMPKDDYQYGEINKAITDILKEYPSANIYVPFACKNHVNHRTVRDIVVAFFRDEVKSYDRLFFYEDLPYAEDLSDYQIKKQQEDFLAGFGLGNATFKKIAVDIGWCWDKKVEAYNIYNSQKDETNFYKIAKHAERLNACSKVESLWILVPKDVAADKSIAWLSWEAARRIGGIGEVIRNVQLDKGYAEEAHRTILIGPMYMPVNVVPESKRDTLDQIAKDNNSYILYYNGKSRHTSVGTGLSRKFKVIEQKFGVSIAYLREYPRSNSAQLVERILIDLSFSITSNEIYSLELKYFLRDLEKHLGISIHFQSKNETLFNNNIIDAGELVNILNAFQNNNASYRHIDNDVIYGLLIAQPAVESLKAILKSNERCILNVMDYFSLPTGYAAILERYNGKIYSKPNNFTQVNYKDYQIRVNYIASEVKPIRNIVEGHYKYRIGNNEISVNSDSFLRALIKSAVGRENNRITLTEIKGFKYIWEHVPLILLQNSWKLDYSWAVSHHVKEELLFLSNDIKEIDYLPHGNKIIAPCCPDQKRHYKTKVFDQLISSYPDVKAFFKSHSDVNQEDFILSIHIARPEICKRLDRDVKFLEHLSTIVHKPIVHLFIGGFSDGYNIKTLTNLKECISEGKEKNKNLCCQIIDDPKWPDINVGLKEDELNRRDLFVASDINLGISSYDSYGLAPLESLSFGTISVISDSSGSAKHLEEITGRNPEMLVGNIVIVKLEVAENWAGMSKDGIEREIEAFNGDKYVEIENRALSAAACELAGKMKIGHKHLINSGKIFSEQCSWENVLGKLILEYKKLFSLA